MKFLKYTLLLLVLFFISRLLAQPQAPQNLIGTSTIFEYQNITIIAVRLKWDKVKDANNVNVPIYRVYKKNGDLSSSVEFNLLSEVLWNSVYSDKDVEVGKTYSYYVTAVDNNGLESSASNEVEVLVTDGHTGGGNSSISGNVTDEITNNPLSGIWVTAISTSTLSAKSELTDDSGNYTIPLFPDEYIIYFRAAQDYFPEYYDNVKNARDASRITLEEGVALKDINASLTPISSMKTYSLSGSVKDGDGNPLKAIVTLIFVNEDNLLIHQKKTETNALGEYNFNIREGSVVVVHARSIDNNGSFYSEFYDGVTSFSEAEKIEVNSDISNINFILDSILQGNSSITGNVFNEQNEPIQAMVLAFKLGAERMNMYSNLRVFTSDDGSYSFNGLIPGDYILFVIPEMAYAPTFFKFDGSTTLRWREADIISLAENDLKENINFTVFPMPEIPTNAFAEIRVRIRNTFGEPIENAFAYAYNDSNKLVSYGYSNEFGEIKFRLTPGFYTISTDNYALSHEESTNVIAGVNEPTVVDFNLSEDIYVSVNSTLLNDDFQLFQNYPNPFNPSTNIEFSIPNSTFVNLKIYDILGNEVATLVNQEMSAGNYKINFDAASVNRQLSSGIYFYRLKTDNFSGLKKMILLR